MTVHLEPEIGQAIGDFPWATWGGCAETFTSPPAAAGRAGVMWT